MKRLDVAAMALGVGLAWFAVGCSKPEAQQAAPTATVTPAPAVVASSPPANPASEARAFFKTKCVVCHGDHGAGDGLGAAAIVPKPRAFADPQWQASTTDDQIRKIILEGGPAVGKSPAMPPNPGLKDKDEVVTALIKVIRDFKK
jgi:mono/diheme cytochrome c family protein